jgi:cysteine desulfurase family protein
VIYLDNAATTLHKPPAVAAAVASALGSFGNIGRGVYGPSLQAARAVHSARQRLAELLNAPSPARVSFAANATEALNIVVEGLLRPGDHAVTTAASHNSILRPLYRKRDQGCDLTVLPIAADGSMDYASFEAALCSRTRLAVVTHASNLTGDVYDIRSLADACHAHKVLLAVDAAQTAGSMPTDMQAQGIDILVFTGHKSLFGPQGTGGLAVADGIEVPAFKVGGSGTHSYDERHPSVMPESLEAGTLNSHGIAGLDAGLAAVLEITVPVIEEKVKGLTARFEYGLRQMAGVRTYGGHAGASRCGIVALNVGDLGSAQVSARLYSEFDICTRSGAHCAPLMHQALGTIKQGAVRLSFSYYNTVEEVDSALAAIGQIAQEATA